MRAAGTNCDAETAYAFESSGAKVEPLHINILLKGEKTLADYQILAIPGGFTYGDDVASGKILANELRLKLLNEITAFVQEGNLVIGICNGFQILVKARLLPAIDGLGGRQEATLTFNDSGKFEDRWIRLRPGNGRPSRCIWTEGIGEPIELPIAHGEGKFVTADPSSLAKLQENRQIVFQYCDAQGRPAGDFPDNPNGSVEGIAGICDPTGRIFGLMPHPERHVWVTQHPCWTRGKHRSKEGDGAKIFRNGVRYAKKNL